MPRAITCDTSRTKSYIPKVSEIPGFSHVLAQFYKPIENHCIHEGRVVDQLYYKSNGIERLFTNVHFNYLFKINEPIVPRFILDFHSQVKVQTDEYGYLLISFMIQHEFITLSLAQFGRILIIPYNGQAVFTNKWDLASPQETKAPHHTDLPTPKDIHRFLQLERVELGGHRDYLPASLAHVLYCIVAEEQYNLPYFFVKRIGCARATPNANLPYGMFLTRLFQYVMKHYPHLANGSYNVIDRVMRPLALKQTRKHQSDRGKRKARHSVSSSSVYHYVSSSHHIDENEDDNDSRARREDMKMVDRGITMINHTQAEAMGILLNVLCQVGVTTLIAKFLILDIPIDRDSPIVVGRGFLRIIGGIINTADRLFSTFDGFCHQTFCAARSDIMRNTKSNSDDEEDYQIKRNKFEARIYGLKPTPYLNCNNPDERSLALQTVTNPFKKISIWKKAVSFLGSLPVPLNNVNWKPNYNGCNRDAKSRYNTRLDQLLPRYIYSPCIVNWDVLNRMGYDEEIDDMLRIRLREAGSDEEIFTYVAWIRAFNINEPIYAELCHEFYSTYKFDEVCVDDELQTKKIIKFRLGGRGLRYDEHFNTQDYWLSISQEENVGLSRSHTYTIRNLILRVIHKMITYGLCQRTTGYDKIQKNDLRILSMFDARHQNRVLTEDVVRSLSASIYCKDLDTIIFRDLIDSDGKLIPEDPQPGAPRVGIPRPLRASMQDLYDRMGTIEIRQRR
nr:retrotransposon Orf1 [Tanacetum cinerariifolium]